MADKIEDSGISKPNESVFLPPAKQPEQHFKDLEAQPLNYEAEQYEQFTSGPDSGLGLCSEATIIANPEAESDQYDLELASAQSEAEVKPAVQLNAMSVSDTSDTKPQHDRHLLAGTINRPPGGTLIAQTMELLAESQPAAKTEEKEPYTAEAIDIDAPTIEAADCGSEEKEANSPNLKPQEDGSEQVSIANEEEPQVEAIVHADPQLHSNTEEDLKAGAVDTTDEAIVLVPDQNTTESVPAPETEAKPNEHDEAIVIAEKMSPANRPQPAGMQATFEEIETRTELPDDEDNCSLPCTISCKGKKYELGYTCDKLKCIALRQGTKSVFRWWTDGLTPRWKLLYMFFKIFFYAALSLAKISIIVVDVVQGDHVVFDLISLFSVAIGCGVSIVYAIVFCSRRRREVWCTIRETWIYIVLKVYKYCCCCTIRRIELLKEKEEEKNGNLEATKRYVEDNKRFKPPQNRLQKFTAVVGNTSEVLLTIVDDVILTVSVVLSLYSFMGKQKFTIFYGSMRGGHIVSFVALVASALNLIVIAHVVRIVSIAINIATLDKKVARDTAVMGLKLPNKCIRYFLSFQARLVYHVLLSSTFQIYCIFVLSWKIIQDSCSVVAPPSIPLGNGTNSSNISPLAGAPFTCNIPLFVNGFTIYNIVYIAVVPTLLGYASFFLCNTPWLVEYMQTITMWTYLQIEYTTGSRVREDDKNDEQGAGGNDSKDDKDRRVYEDSGKTAYITPATRLLRIFCGNLLCDITDDELRGVGANAEINRQTIQKDYDAGAEKFGSNVVSSAFMKLERAAFFVPAAIVGVLQVILFLAHLVFMGCSTRTCFSSNIHAVFSSVVFEDVAALFFPMIILFLMTSYPGPWVGIFWVLVVFGVILIIVGIVSLLAAVIFVVMLLIVMTVCASSPHERERRVY